MGKREKERKGKFFSPRQTHQSSVGLTDRARTSAVASRALLSFDVHQAGRANAIVRLDSGDKHSTALQITRVPSDSEANPRRHDAMDDDRVLVVATALRARASTASVVDSRAARASDDDEDEAAAEAAASRLAAWRNMFWKGRERRERERFPFLCSEPRGASLSGIRILSPNSLPFSR
jgi:hypothetical protein